MPDSNPFAAKFALGPQQQSPVPAPNMQQAGAMPKAAPAPIPTSGFSKPQGGLPAIGKPMGGDEQ